MVSKTSLFESMPFFAFNAFPAVESVEWRPWLGKKGFKTGAAEVGGQAGHLPTQFSAESCNEYLSLQKKKVNM